MRATSPRRVVSSPHRGLNTVPSPVVKYVRIGRHGKSFNRIFFSPQKAKSPPFPLFKSLAFRLSMSSCPAIFFKFHLNSNLNLCVNRRIRTDNSNMSSASNNSSKSSNKASNFRWSSWASDCWPLHGTETPKKFAVSSPKERLSPPTGWEPRPCIWPLNTDTPEPARGCWPQESPRMRGRRWTRRRCTSPPRREGSRSWSCC